MQAGCDYRFAGGFVIGLQGDYAATIVLGTAYTARETRSGWTIGVGAEHAFTNFLSGFVEYGYYDFGTREIAFTPQIAGLGPAFLDIKETKSVGRAGLDLRFGGYGASIAAKYPSARGKSTRSDPTRTLRSSRKARDPLPGKVKTACSRRGSVRADHVTVEFAWRWILS